MLAVWILSETSTVPPMVTSASFAIFIAANTESHALSLIAWLIADMCNISADLIASLGISEGVIKLAAEPLR